MSAFLIQATLLLTSATVVCLLGLRLVRGDRAHGLAPMIETTDGRRTAGVAVLATIAIWQSSQGLEFFLPDHAITLHRVGYIGIALLPAAVFWMAQLIAERSWPDPRWLLIVPAITVALNVSGVGSELLWSATTRGEGAGRFLVIDYGPWFWVHTANSYVCLVGAFALISRHAYQRPLRRREGGTILLALALPVSANFVEISVPGLDAIALTAIALAGTAGLLAWAAMQDDTTLLLPHVRRQLVDAMSEPVMVIDARRIVIFTNPPGARLLGIAQGETVGIDAVPQLAAFLDGAIAEGDVTFDVHEDTHHYHAVQSMLDEQEHIALLVLRDVTIARASQERIRRLAYYDPLTGLPNRRLMQRRLARALEGAEQSRCQLAVLCIDVDRFKQVNDSLGHSAGDRLLQIVGERLLDAVRPMDEVGMGGQSSAARLGGDEFVLLLTGLPDGSVALQIAERLRRCFDTPVVLEGREVLVGISIGVALYPDAGLSPHDLLRHADRAMYRAKASPGTAVEVAVRGLPEDEVASEDSRLGLEAALRRALERGEFALEHQPIFTAEGGVLLGTEALLRWRHPDGRVIGPGEFVPIAEDDGLVIPIGRWVIATAVEQVRKWRERVPGLTVSVNLSPVQLRDEDFLDDLRAAVATLDAPSALRLELTESLLVHDLDHSERVLGEIEQLGVELVLDDFGTGYSSLGYLHRLPFRTVKIDRSFVEGLPDCQRSRRLCRAIIDMAHGLDLRVVAEGIETEDQLDFLRALGCDAVQGFWLGRPTETANIDLLLAREVARRALPPSEHG